MAKKKSITKVNTTVDLKEIFGAEEAKYICDLEKSQDEFCPIPKWLLVRKISATSKIVYVVLRNYARMGHNLAYPSISKLAKNTGLTRPTIRKAIKELHELKLISIGTFKEFNKKVYGIRSHPWQKEYDGILRNTTIKVDFIDFELDNDDDNLDDEVETDLPVGKESFHLETEETEAISKESFQNELERTLPDGKESFQQWKDPLQGWKDPLPKKNNIKENIKEDYILCENFSPDQPETEFKPKPDKATDKPSHKTKDKKFSLDEMIKKMAKDKRKHINIIASLIKYTNPEIENKEQLRAYVTRHSRSAKQLEGFDLFKIEAVMEWLNNKCQEWEDPHWTLETVLKYIFEFEGKKENNTIKEKLEPNPPKNQQANFDKKPQSQPFDPIKYGRRMARQRWARLHPEEARELYDMEASASWDAKNELSPEEVKKKMQLAHYKFAQKYPDLANELMQMEREEVLKAMGNSSNDNKVDSGAFRRYLESRGMAKSKGQPQKISEILQGGSDEEQEDELPF